MTTQPQDKMRAEIIEAVRAAWHAAGIQDDGWDWADFAQEIEWNAENPKCGRCDGSGQRTRPSNNGPDAVEELCACNLCDGSGTVKKTAVARDQSEASATLAQIAEVTACFGADWPDVDGEPEVLRRVKWAARQLKEQSAQSHQDARDAAFEAVRHRLCKLQKYSFFIVDGRVLRSKDSSGNWLEFESVHSLFDPVVVDAAIATQGASNV